MEVRKIEPRDEIQVYVGARGHVCIKQIKCDEESIVIVHREDVEQLINHIKAVYQEAMDFVPEPEEEED